MATEEKPSRNEDEYFVKQDAERLRALRAQLDADRAKQERSSHFMKCPKCGADLREVEHHQVKIDECTECGGVWFDKGELGMLQQAAAGGGLQRVVSSIFGKR